MHNQSQEQFFAEREAKNVPLCLKGKQNENVKLNDVSYRSWRLGSLYEGSSNGKIIWNSKIIFYNIVKIFYIYTDILNIFKFFY